MDKTFIYQGIEFKAIRKLTKLEGEKCWKGDILNFNEWFSLENYNYQDFYEKAKEIKVDEIDIFEIGTGIFKGISVVPCKNYLGFLIDKENSENYYKLKIAEKCSELYEELYNSKTSLFRPSNEIQIYWNNKNGYELQGIIDFENKSFILEVDSFKFMEMKFNNFLYLKEWLKNIDKNYFDKEYSDRKMSEIISLIILNGNIELKTFDRVKQDIMIIFLYKSILYYIYQEKSIVDSKIRDFEDEFVEVGDKSNDELFREIREDILYSIRKEINYFLFENVDKD